MSARIDIDALRRSAEQVDAGHAPVSRRWLAAALAEIEAGRAAQAELARHKGMAEAIDKIGRGSTAS
ncbi:MAG TPA: hypothetical protein VGB54_11170 [Allosphingosinicella sp.]